MSDEGTDHTLVELLETEVCFHLVDDYTSYYMVFHLYDVEYYGLLVASCVDYCNGVLFQTTAVHLHPVQSVMNAAARLVVKERKWDSITQTLRDTLHWLLVRERIDFTLCLLVYKRLHQLAAPVPQVDDRSNIGSVDASPPTVCRSR